MQITVHALWEHTPNSAPSVEHQSFSDQAGRVRQPVRKLSRFGIQQQAWSSDTVGAHNHHAGKSFLQVSSRVVVNCTARACLCVDANLANASQAEPSFDGTSDLGRLIVRWLLPALTWPAEYGVASLGLKARMAIGRC